MFSYKYPTTSEFASAFALILKNVSSPGCATATVPIRLLSCAASADSVFSSDAVPSVVLSVSSVFCVSSAAASFTLAVVLTPTRFVPAAKAAIELLPASILPVTKQAAALITCFFIPLFIKINPPNTQSINTKYIQSIHKYYINVTFITFTS